MKICLKDIAELQPGVYLKANENATSTAYMLGIKDFDENLKLVEPSVIVDRSEVKDKYIIEEDHILFSTRLIFNAFKLYETKNVYVASNSFILIKPNIEKIHSGYLRWLRSWQYVFFVWNIKKIKFWKVQGRRSHSSHLL